MYLFTAESFLALDQYFKAIKTCKLEHSAPECAVPKPFTDNIIILNWGSFVSLFNFVVTREVMAKPQKHLPLVASPTSQDFALPKVGRQEPLE